jgi:hypothetical protein
MASGKTAASAVFQTSAWTGFFLSYEPQPPKACLLFHVPKTFPFFCFLQVPRSGFSFLQGVYMKNAIPSDVGPLALSLPSIDLRFVIESVQITPPTSVLSKFWGPLHFLQQPPYVFENFLQVSFMFPISQYFTETIILLTIAK